MAIEAVTIKGVEYLVRPLGVSEGLALASLGSESEKTPEDVKVALRFAALGMAWTQAPPVGPKMPPRVGSLVEYGQRVAAAMYPWGGNDTYTAALDIYGGVITDVFEPTADEVAAATDFSAPASESTSAAG